MKEYVGVKSWLGATITKSFPKREALLFNKIAVPDIRLGIQMLENSEDAPKDFINELESLLEQGILFQPTIILSPKLSENDEYRLYRELSSELERDMLEFMKSTEFRNVPVPDNILHKILEAIESEKQTIGSLSQPERYLLNGFIHGDYEARRVSVQLRELDNAEAFPILSVSPYLVQKEKTDKTDVLEIVLKALPVPDDSVSWEQIHGYRSDPDSVGKFLSLRTWMNKLVRDKLSPTEIEEELEHLIHEYQEHLKLHRMKTNLATVKTLVIGKADLIRNLVTFKWGKITETIFALKERRVALMEAG